MTTSKSAPSDSYRVKHQDFSRPHSGRNGRVFLGDQVHRLEPVPPETWQLAIVASLLLLLYSCIVIEIQISLFLFYALVLTGLVTSVRSTVSRPFTDAEQTGLLILLVFFLVSLLTYWINGMPGRGDILVEGRHAKFLLVIPVYLFFRHFSLSNKLLWLLAFGVSLLLFVVALIDINTVDGYGWPGRASGAASPSVFAVLTMTMMCMLFAFRDTWSAKPWPRNTARLGIIVAMTTVFLTESYGIWLALPLVIAMFIGSRIKRLRIRHVLQLVMGLCCIIFVSLQVPPYKNLWVDYAAFQRSVSPLDPVHSTNTGIKLENWRASISMIKENPLLGVGPGGYQATAKRFFEAGGWAPTVVDHSGPENLYLGAFATRGVFGLLTTLLLLIAPMLYCYRIRNSVGDEDIEQYAFAAILVVGVFFIAGLSVDVLESKPLSLIYCTTIALLIGQIRQRLEN